MWIMKFLWMKGTQRCLSTEKTTENGLSLYSGVAGPHRVATSVVGELQRMTSFWATSRPRREIWSVGGGAQMQMGAASEEPALTLWQGSRTAAWQHHMGYSLRTQAHKTVAATHDEYFIFLHKSTCKVENAAFPFILPPIHTRFIKSLTSMVLFS